MLLPGSEWLAKTLHLAAQSLLIPVIVCLLLCLAYALVELGGLLTEYGMRRRAGAAQVKDLLDALQSTQNVADAAKTLDGAALSAGQKAVLKRLLACDYYSEAALRAYARRLLEEEELTRARLVERTDLLARLGPILGLMGTLIPLGPGLAALGAGDVRGLAEAVIIAFDTTVVGLAAGGIGFFISRVRRRWYEDYLGTLEAGAAALLEVVERAKKKKAFASWRGRG